MSYLHRGNGYEPTGNVNGEPNLDPEGYPAPAEVHPRDLDAEAFGGDLEPEPGDAEYPAGAEVCLGTYPGFIEPQDRVELDRPLPAREDLEVLARLRKIVGTGPYVIVKLDAEVQALAGSEPVPVTIGWGNGITEHLADMVLGMGRQALVERAQQQHTQELAAGVARVGRVPQ